MFIVSFSLLCERTCTARASVMYMIISPVSRRPLTCASENMRECTHSLLQEAAENRIQMVWVWYQILGAMLPVDVTSALVDLAAPNFLRTPRITSLRHTLQLISLRNSKRYLMFWIGLDVSRGDTLDRRSLTCFTDVTTGWWVLVSGRCQDTTGSIPTLLYQRAAC